MATERDTVLLALGGEHVCRNYLDSVLELLAHDLTSDDGRLAASLSISTSDHALEDACARSAREFLTLGEDWLLWTDLDQGWRPDVLGRLHEHADPVERPIVSALTFIWDQAEQDGYHGWLCKPRPSILVENEGRFWVPDDFPEDALVPISATGMGLVLIHRRVFLDIEAKFGPVWFDRMAAPDGTRMGSDVSFYARAREVGIQPYVHTGIGTNHAKTCWIGPQIHKAWIGSRTAEA